MPAAYLERVAKRAPKALERERLLALAQQRRDAAVAAAPELGTLSAEARAAVDVTATECANLFQLTGVPQRDLFEYVLVRMPDLARPRVSAGAVMTH